jgi:benzoyl-CoA reductase/2-hydroxyglutaryl-CoA dehydratase subunit BcrC/BadD/HgdB
MKALKEQGRGVVGTFCTYVPAELFLAAGLVPVGLCSTSDETIGEAEKVLPRNLCPLINASYGFAATDKCPYMYFSDLVVGETTCDGKIKMFELLGKIKDVHVMELPHSQDKPASRSLWMAEIKRLQTKVEEKFGVTITAEKLRNAIRERNKERVLLKKVYELSVSDPPPITGLQQLQILFGAQFKFDHEKKIQELQETINRISQDYQDHQNGKAISAIPGSGSIRPATNGHPAKRIIVTGCPIGGATEKFVRVIEESGAVVVAYENCTGAKQFDRQIGKSAGARGMDGSEGSPLDEQADPYEELCDYYLNIGCSVMSPNPNRFELLGRLCDQFKADGVLEMVLQSCHTYAIESHTVGEFLKARNIPFMSLETDYSSGDTEQLKNRIAAFIEML